MNQFTIRFIKNLVETDTIAENSEKTLSVEAVLFDADYYLANNPDIIFDANYNKDPFLHYVNIGKAAGKKATPIEGNITYEYQWYVNGVLNTNYTGSSIIINGYIYASKTYYVIVNVDLFDDAWYLSNYTGLSGYNLTTVHDHFTSYGFFEGKYPSQLVLNQSTNNTSTISINPSSWAESSGKTSIRDYILFKLGTNANVRAVSNISTVSILSTTYVDKYFYTRDNSIDDKYNYISNLKINFDANFYLKEYLQVANNAYYGKHPYQHYIDYGINENKKSSPYAFNVYIPIYGSSVKYISRLNYLETVDNAIKVIPNSENNLTIRYNLKFLLDDYAAGNLLKTIEVAAGYKPLNFFDPSNFYTEVIGLVEDYSINKTSSNLNEISITLSSYFKVPSFNWKTSRLLGNVGYFNLPTDPILSTKIKYKNINNVLNPDDTDKKNIIYNSYLPSFGSPYFIGRNYKKYDFVFIKDYENPGLDNFWFAKKDISAGEPFSDDAWTKDFIHESKYPFNFKNKFDVKQLEYKNSFIQNVKHKDNANTIKSYEIRFENISDFQAKSILFYFEKKSGFRKFRYDFPKFFKKEKVFIAIDWEHTINYKDSNNIVATFVEDPNAMFPTTFPSLPLFDTKNTIFNNSTVYGYSSDSVNFYVPVFSKYPATYKWTTTATYPFTELELSRNPLTLTNLDSRMQGSYTLQASNAAGVINSETKSITVKYKPEISTQPFAYNSIFIFPSTQRFYVTAKNITQLGDTTFIWRKNGQVVATCQASSKDFSYSSSYYEDSVTGFNQCSDVYDVVLANKNTSLINNSPITSSTTLIKFDENPRVISGSIDDLNLSVAGTKLVQTSIWGKAPFTIQLIKNPPYNLESSVVSSVTNTYEPNFSYTFPYIKSTDIATYYFAYKPSNYTTFLTTPNFKLNISDYFKFTVVPIDITYSLGTSYNLIYKFIIASPPSSIFNPYFSLFYTITAVITKNDVPIKTVTITSGDTEITISQTFNSIILSDVAFYRLVVTGITYYNSELQRGHQSGDGKTVSYYSEYTTINVPNSPPVIAYHPSSTAEVEIKYQNSRTFTVISLGSTLNYQWYRKRSTETVFTPITGETSKSFSINNADTTADGYYYVVITNSFGTATSNTVRVKIVIPPSIGSTLTGITNETYTSTLPVLIDKPFSIQQDFFGNYLTIKWYRVLKAAPYTEKEILSNTLLSDPNAPSYAGWMINTTPKTPTINDKVFTTILSAGTDDYYWKEIYEQFDRLDLYNYKVVATNSYGTASKVFSFPTFVYYPTHAAIQSSTQNYVYYAYETADVVNENYVNNKIGYYVTELSAQNISTTVYRINLGGYNYDPNFSTSKNTINNIVLTVKGITRLVSTVISRFLDTNSYDIKSGWIDYIASQPLTYQWYRDDVAITGATSSTYNPDLSGTYTYSKYSASITFKIPANWQNPNGLTVTLRTRGLRVRIIDSPKIVSQLTPFFTNPSQTSFLVAYCGVGGQCQYIQAVITAKGSNNISTKIFIKKPTDVAYSVYTNSYPIITCDGSAIGNSNNVTVKMPINPALLPNPNSLPFVDATSVDVPNNTNFCVRFYAENGSDAIACSYVDTSAITVSVKNKLCRNPKPFGNSLYLSNTTQYLSIIEGQTYTHKFCLAPCTPDTPAAYSYEFSGVSQNINYQCSPAYNYPDNTKRIVCNNNADYSVQLILTGCAKGGTGYLSNACTGYNGFYTPQTCINIYTINKATNVDYQYFNVSVCNYGRNDLIYGTGFNIYGSTISSIANSDTNVNIKFCFDAPGFPFNVYLFEGPYKSYYTSTTVTVCCGTATSLGYNCFFQFWEYKCIATIATSLSPRCAHYTTGLGIYNNIIPYYCVDFNYNFTSVGATTYKFNSYGSAGFPSIRLSERIYFLVIAPNASLTYTTRSFSGPFYYPGTGGAGAGFHTSDMTSNIPLFSSMLSLNDWIYNGKLSNYNRAFYNPNDPQGGLILNSAHANGINMNAYGFNATCKAWCDQFHAGPQWISYPAPLS